MSEDFTQRATCECYYKFENAADPGEDTQGQIDLTNDGVVQNADYPNSTYGSSAIKSGDFELSEADNMEASHADSSEIDNLTAMTWLCWMKHESHPTQMNYVVKSNYFITNGFAVIWHGGGTLRFYFGGTVNSQTWTPTDDVWYFLAATYSQASDALRLFTGTDAVQVSQLGSDVTGTDLSGATTGGFAIGANIGGGQPVDGLKTEVAIFSEELSLAELQEIQADGMEGTPAGNPYYAYAQQ